MNDIESNNKARHTIRDIADASGVSPKTVSFVLNGKEGVAERTRRRVLKVVGELEYRPHMGARALRGRVARSIGVIFPTPAKIAPLSRSLLVWLYDELISIFGSRGYYVTFDMATHASGSNGDYARGVWEHAFGPCFLAGPLALDDTVVQRLHERGIPYVGVNRLESFPECSAATVDYEQAAYLSTKYLIDKGHTRIGMLKAFRGYQSGLERRRGYERALDEAGIARDNSLIRSATFEAHTAVNDVHWLLRDSSVTALIDCSSMEDPAVMREGARRAGRRLGKDIETVVWTYRYETMVLPEASAHMCLPLRQASAEGLEQLADWIEGKRQGPINIVYQPTLFETIPHAPITDGLRVFHETD